MKLISMHFLIGFAIFNAVCANASIILPPPDLRGGLSPAPGALIGDLECVAVNGKSDLSLRHTLYGLRLAIHSQELSQYIRIAYGVELGRLEAVRESDGTPILNLTPDGFTAMAYAPTANRPELLWAVDFKNGTIGDKTTKPVQSTVRLIDAQGHLTELSVDCAPQPTP